MSLTRIWFAGVVMSGVAILAACDNLRAQTWQDASKNAESASTDWEQRVLKQPQQQWHAARQQAEANFQPVAHDEPAVQYKDPVVQYQPSTSTRQPAAPNQTARHQAYERNAFDAGVTPKRPVATARQRVALASGEEVIDPGQTQFEPVATQGAFADNGGCASCGGTDGGCDDCGQCGAPCGNSCDFGWEVFDGRCGPWLRGLSVFAGIDGFKGPLDRGTNGNFGVNEGLSLARPLGDPWGCGYQLGANFVQTDFSGVKTVGAENRDSLFPASYRKQYFTTASIFRRADPTCGGFQWAVAYDYLYDMYFQNASLQQIRSETGFVLNETYEIGYFGAYGVGGDQAWNGRTIDGKLEPTDMFALYVRRNFENGGDGRVWAGATGNGDGLIGADLWVPLGKSFAIENRINYMIPKGGRDTAQTKESWGMMFQLVWYPGQNAMCQKQNPYRPVLNVADNSLFMVDRLAH